MGNLGSLILFTASAIAVVAILSTRRSRAWFGAGSAVPGVFSRYTDRARRAVVLAQEEARLLGHSHLGSAHLLLGLIHEGEGRAATALTGLGLTLDRVREQVLRAHGRGDGSPGRIPFSHTMRFAIGAAEHEARRRGDHHVGTEHLLLGLFLEHGDAVRSLRELLGPDMEPAVRDALGATIATVHEQTA
ncbi:ATP-dependent Clp protease ATP-binding subunit ClpC [Stackebrandtia albiflava]|uniref:ATP-dependent Clp protease ATP-binding subunit ClpC n=1 Tax=Stackebrandtia albiflava TaxID=406432 RepID=A0A562V0Z0_9ACTN|nr:Clp protease N-terminal domain-containing protein [Stackebrandtia albiflava]TWJ11559.1 ATP-dependent Clp protease ATP-binding subunit ClpC [Stackebrandtia albiflava]